MVEETKYVVYALADPRTKEIRYIGKTGDLDQRKSRHSSGNTHGQVACWEKELVEEGLSPICTLLEEELTAEQVDEWERFWIERGKRLGWSLLNILPGGNGWYAGAVPESVRQKISETVTAQWQDSEYREEHVQRMTEVLQKPEVRKRMSKAASERTISPEVRQRISDTMTEKWQDPAYAEHQREAVAEGARSLWERDGFREEHTEAMRKPETRERIAEASRQMWQDPVSRAKLLEERRSRGKSSDETRAKIAAGVRRNWEERRRRKQENGAIARER